MELAGYVHTDVTLGHCRYPVYASAYVSNIMEGGLGMENDGTREYGWCRINDNLHPITNHPQDYISYAQWWANDGGGVWTWTFPQGGFANNNVTVVASLEGSAAHMQAGESLHTVFHEGITSTQVTFHVDHWGVFGAGVITPAPCNNATVYINAIAIGPPK